MRLRSLSHSVKFLFFYIIIFVYSRFFTLIFFRQPSAQRVASVSAITENRGKAKSGSIWESLSRRTSAISASSLVNLATRTTCVLNDIQQLHLDKRNIERQTNKKIEEKKEKQNKEIQEEKEEQYNLGEKRKIQEKKEGQDKEIQTNEERKDTEKEQKMTK